MAGRAAKRPRAKSAPEGRPGPTQLSDLVPDPENRRLHNERNLGMVADALTHVGAARSIVIDENNVILAGNGVTAAAGKAGITKLRIIDTDGDEIIAVRRTGLSEEKKRALAIYDNRAGELAEWNPEQLSADLAAGLDLSPWFSKDEVDEIAKKATGDDEYYSTKIESPIYTPKGEQPPVSALCDRATTETLFREIDEADLGPDVAAFLKCAAERHSVFKFREIAEFYAHAEPKIQRLMEASGLIIIDFNQAIERGFVRLTERLGEIADGEDFTRA